MPEEFTYSTRPRGGYTNPNTLQTNYDWTIVSRAKADVLISQCDRRLDVNSVERRLTGPGHTWSSSYTDRNRKEQLVKVQRRS